MEHERTLSNGRIESPCTSEGDLDNTKEMIPLLNQATQPPINQYDVKPIRHAGSPKPKLSPVRCKQR